MKHAEALKCAKKPAGARIPTRQVNIKASNQPAANGNIFIRKRVRVRVRGRRRRRRRRMRRRMERARHAIERDQADASFPRGNRSDGARGFPLKISLSCR
jgi:hypothetical protein